MASRPLGVRGADLQSAKEVAGSAASQYSSDERRVVYGGIFREACDLKSSFKVINRCGLRYLAGRSGGDVGRRTTRRGSLRKR